MFVSPVSRLGQSDVRLAADDRPDVFHVLLI